MMIVKNPPVPSLWPLIALCVVVILGVAAIRCNGGEKEETERIASKYGATHIDHTLPDRTRVDLLTPRYAIEVDWADKHWESYGQAVHYSLMTGRRPAIVLLTDDPRKDRKHLERAKRLARVFRIRLWIERVDAE